MTRVYLILLIGTILSGTTTDALSNGISDSLKTNADAIVLNSNKMFIYKNANEGTLKVVSKIIVYNKHGLSAANFIYYGNINNTIKSFKGTVTHLRQSKPQKISFKDLIVTEYSSNFKDNSKIYFYNLTSLYFPCIVEYEYTASYTNGMLSCPVFLPQYQTELSILESHYTLQVPKKVKLRFYSSQLPEPEYSENDKEISTYHWQVNNLTARKNEPFSNYDINNSICALIYPSSFTYDKTIGTIDTWEDLGNWTYKLQQNRGAISAQHAAMIQELVKDAQTEHEKIEIVYKYLAANTRYVSIQLGIGGYQTIPASEVEKNKFGDCKALSNYMQSLLRSVGITSYYTLIESNSKPSTLLENYPNFGQINHVILMVPIQNDTLWLECTDASLPMGYIHSGIRGKQAIICKAEGSEIVYVPDNSDEKNIQSRQYDISIDLEGKMNGAVIESNEMNYYEKVKSLKNNVPKDIKNYISNTFEIQDIGNSNWRSVEIKGHTPKMIFSYDISYPYYGKKMRNRLLVPINNFRVPFVSFTKEERQNPISINREIYEKDSIIMRLPKEYNIESLPQNIEINTSFAQYNSTITYSKQEHIVIVKQDMLLKKGVYPKEAYSELVNFMETVNNTYKSRVILISK